MAAPRLALADADDVDQDRALSSPRAPDPPSRLRAHATHRAHPADSATHSRCAPRTRSAV